MNTRFLGAAFVAGVSALALVAYLQRAGQDASVYTGMDESEQRIVSRLAGILSSDVVSPVAIEPRDFSELGDEYEGESHIAEFEEESTAVVVAEEALPEVSDEWRASAGTPVFDEEEDYLTGEAPEFDEEQAELALLENEEDDFARAFEVDPREIPKGYERAPFDADDPRLWPEAEELAVDGPLIHPGDRIEIKDIYPEEIDADEFKLETEEINDHSFSDVEPSLPLEGLPAVSVVETQLTEADDFLIGEAEALLAEVELTDEPEIAAAEDSSVEEAVEEIQPADEAEPDMVEEDAVSVVLSEAAVNSELYTAEIHEGRNLVVLFDNVTGYPFTAMEGDRSEVLFEIPMAQDAPSGMTAESYRGQEYKPSDYPGWCVTLVGYHASGFSSHYWIHEGADLHAEGRLLEILENMSTDRIMVDILEEEVLHKGERMDLRVVCLDGYWDGASPLQHTALYRVLSGEDLGEATVLNGALEVSEELPETKPEED